MLPAASVPASRYEVRITPEQHNRFVRAAKVWQPPQTEDILSSEPNGFHLIDRVDCEFVPYQFPGGATPKFLCAVIDKNGVATKEVVKIKYGPHNSEIPGEVAGGKLLRHLGFGGDHMQVARVLVCYGDGCPKSDDRSVTVQPLAGRSNDHVLDWVSVERRMEGHELLVGDKQGFRISELAAVPRTGDDRAQADALFLLLAFVNHGDSKPENQRLMCLPDQMDEATRECRVAFAMVHDTGTFFGSGSHRQKLKLSAWSPEHVFSAPCTVQVHSGWSGSNFPPIRISEAGRQFLLTRLRAMVAAPDHNQVRNLFIGAHVEMDADSTIDGWVNAFIAKVGEIERMGPCE